MLPLMMPLFSADHLMAGDDFSFSKPPRSLYRFVSLVLFAFTGTPGASLGLEFSNPTLPSFQLDHWVADWSHHSNAVAF